MPRILWSGCITLLLSNLCMAQSLNGFWYGRAEANTVGTVNSYLCEITLKKNNKGFAGVLNYYFGSDEFSAPITAKYWPTTKTIELNPFPLITYFANDKNAPDCIMDGSLTLYLDGPDSVLYGQLNPVGKYRNGCPIMTIYLRREKGAIKEYEDAEKFEPATPEIPVAREEEPILVSSDVFLPMADSLSVPVENTSKGVENRQAIEALNARNFISGPLFEVQTDSIFLYLYDNGKVDNDTISVFLNRLPVALNMALSVKPIILKLKLEPGENEVSLFAVNLGDIPPNTALCIMYAGDKRYDINLSSTLASNGTIRVQRKEPQKENDP